MERVRGPWLDPEVGEEDCWEWIGGWRSRFGYGRIREGGAHSRCLQAHIAVYEMLRGPIPAGQLLRHSCDRPTCCNPAHGVPGSALENYRDQVARRRRPFGRAA